MNQHRQLNRFFLILAIFLNPALGFAHCDTMDGPVVKAARHSLGERNPDPVLIWVQPQDEAEIRSLFEKAVRVRQAGGEAQELADRYFLETVVRIHRRGEGEAYTGLKPAGTVEKKLAAADAALAAGSPQQLLDALPEAKREQAAKKFSVLLKKKSYNAGDLVNGREFVREYVQFMHWLEGGEEVHHGKHGHESPHVNHM